MQENNLKAQPFRYVNNPEESYLVTGDLHSYQSAKLVILDNEGNLISRQVLKLTKGENKIPVSKTDFSDAALHVMILYFNNEVVFSQLIMNNR